MSKEPGTPLATWEDWFSLGATLPTVPGVHAPSRFSALLAATMGDCRDKKVVDAGCGAGLIAIAALKAGARHVVAIDIDAAATQSTRDNVGSLLGEEALSRLSTLQLDFRDLARVEADLLAVNPPQRPSSILEAVEEDQRHLHEGGGVDGLKTLRQVLAHANADVVRSTAADVLPIRTIDTAQDRWFLDRRVHTAILPMHPSWAPLAGVSAPVTVWDIRLRASLVEVAKPLCISNSIITQRFALASPRRPTSTQTNRARRAGRSC